MDVIAHIRVSWDTNGTWRAEVVEVSRSDTWNERWRDAKGEFALGPTIQAALDNLNDLLALYKS